MYFKELQKLLINLTKRNITYADIATALGRDRSNITYKINNNVHVKSTELEKISDYFKIPINSFATNVLKENNFVSLPVLGNVTASMGYGVTVYDETKTGTYAINNQLAKDLGLSLNQCDVIFAKGDSMEPTIIGGDSLLIDKSKKEVVDGRIYCIRYEGELFVKRLQKIPYQKIKVISDNIKYDSWYVDFSKDLPFDFEVIGEVMWWGRVAR